jgi:hypothetical protein
LLDGCGQLTSKSIDPIKQGPCEEEVELALAAAVGKIKIAVQNVY